MDLHDVAILLHMVPLGQVFEISILRLLLSNVFTSLELELYLIKEADWLLVEGVQCRESWLHPEPLVDP
jgi:hypothetical protein